MSKTTIAWTQETWNPVRGCSRISPGCVNCYAERMAARGLPGHKSPMTGEPFAVVTPSGPRWTGKVELIPSMLDIPLRRKKPTTYFVNSMSDLFHEGLAAHDIDKVFAIMSQSPLHTFQVLTKRPKQMLEYMRAERTPEGIDEAGVSFGWCHANVDGRWPLPNVWVGVSVEDQQRADERIPLLLQTPAAVRFLSVEPLLGPVDLGFDRWVRLPHTVISELPFPPIPYVRAGVHRAEANPHGALSVRTEDGEMLGIRPSEFERLPKLDWCIAGGESGPGARPCDVAWIRSIVQQCKAAGVPVFVKQLGAFVVGPPADWHGHRISGPGATGNGFEERIRIHLKDPKGGDMSEWPEDLRVRELPR